MLANDANGSAIERAFVPSRRVGVHSADGHAALLFARQNPIMECSSWRPHWRPAKLTGFYRTQLSEEREYVRMPELEKLAIHQLDDPGPSVARDATQALQHYGSAAAKDALWARLEKLHQQWKDKPDELLHPQPNMFVYDQDSGSEQALVQGTSLGQAWFADAAMIQRPKELSSPAMQIELGGTLQMLRGGEFTLDMRWWPEEVLNSLFIWYPGEGMGSFKEKFSTFRRVRTLGSCRDFDGSTWSSPDRVQHEIGDLLLSGAGEIDCLCRTTKIQGYPSNRPDCICRTGICLA